VIGAAYPLMCRPGMARQLWFLRHADAEPHGSRLDSERRLTARGERQARVAGKAIAQLGLNFDAVLVSPKERALRTAVLAAAAWGAAADADSLTVHPPLAGGFESRQAFEALHAVPADGRLLLVGHEPDLSGVIADLTGGLVDLKKGSLACVRLQSAGGELVVLLRPRELALVAGDVDADV
jgi:phosphohistidine phosphatase